MDFANSTFEQMRRHCLIRFVLTPVTSLLLTLDLFFILLVGGIEGFWLIDSSCS
jgi:hypothetical protein